MNTTATYSSDHSWSRRCSTETVFSIQGKETDYARDTSDTDGPAAGNSDVEYEPVTESEGEDAAVDLDVDGDSSAQSDNNIISTKVLEVSVGDDGSLQFADSEQTETYESDSEMDLFDYWHCARCRAENNNPLYRYCQKCFQVRKSFFPPRPRPKRNSKPKIQTDKADEIPRTMSQDSGVDSLNSQEIQEDAGEGTSNSRLEEPVRKSLSSPRPKRKKNNEPKLQTHLLTEMDEIPRTMSQDSGVDSLNSQETHEDPGEGSSEEERPVSRCKKRRADFAERQAKRKRLSRTDSGSDTTSDTSQTTETVRPLVKTVSDPAISVENLDVKITKKVIANSLIDKMEPKDLCVVCVAEPKSGAFVHGRIAHICCCYKCAVKVWATVKRCPVCNCKVSNVLRAIVM